MREKYRTEQSERGNPPLGSGSPLPRLLEGEGENAADGIGAALKRGPRESEKAFAAFRWSGKHGWQQRVAEHTAALGQA